ncbi:MAG: hypothetical protein AAGB48_02785 [Planctomycetota bacterium]
MPEGISVVIVCLSPYALTAQHPSAMLALLLADHVRTVLPAPGNHGSLAALGEAVAVTPIYGTLLEAWSWSIPLWHAGVIDAQSSGSDAAAAVRRCESMIESEDAFAPLRPLVPGVHSRDDDAMLGHFAADLLKSGPDPAFGIPVAAGLDRLAAEQGFIAAREGPSSLASRAESAMLRPIVRIAIPYLSQASGQRLLAVRADLADELDALRDATEAWRPDAIRAAAETYQAAFSRQEPDLTRSVDPDEPRVLAGVARLTLGELPVDAVLAACANTIRGLDEDPLQPSEDPKRSTLMLRAMQVEPMGGRARHAHGRARYRHA